MDCQLNGSDAALSNKKVRRPGILAPAPSIPITVPSEERR